MGTKNEAPWDWKLIAARFKARRLLFDWTLDEAARRAGVSRDTVIRVEHGHRCSLKSLHALRAIYGLFSAQLVRRDVNHQSENFVSCRAEDVQWMAANNRNYKGDLVKEMNYLFVNDPNERKRRADLGYQRFFSGFLGSELVGGVMSAGLLELYQPSPTDRHFGEEFIYCLSGRASIMVEGEICELEPGDSIVFDATKLHQYSPADDTRLPAIILFVVATRPDEGDRIERAIPSKREWGV